MARKKYNGVSYDTDIDYKKQYDLAVEQGDYALAAAIEKTRNAKIDGEGLNYSKTNNYSRYPKPGASSPAAENYSGIPGVKKRGSYSDGMDKTLRQISAMGFHYNPQSDPLYRQIKGNYEKTAGNVIENTMGSYAGMTGGVPSSYAVSAAAQAGARHMQGADDMIPELYRLAYSKFADDKADLYNQYGMMADLENREYNRAVYEREYTDARNDIEYEKKQAELAAKAASEKSDTEYAKWLAEFIADREEKGLDRRSDEQKYYSGLVFDMAENGSVPSDEMMEMANIPMTGQQFYDNYINEYNRQLSEKNKYKGGPVTGEFKKPTSAMYSAVDSLFKQGKGAVGLDRLLERYDWNEYNREEMDDYIKTYYGDVEGVSEYFYEPSFAEKYAGKINTAFKKKNGDRYSALKANGDGTYSISDSEPAYIIKAVFEDDSLTQEEAETLLFDYFGITEKQVQDMLNDRHYR